MKLLHAEDGGLVLHIKRLEEGTFRLPKYDQQSKSYPMEWRDLVMMVEGYTYPFQLEEPGSPSLCRLCIKTKKY